MRHNAIHTIGRLSNADRAHLLSDAFPFYLANDPINLPCLLFELKWLTREHPWHFVEQVAVAQHYLIRWSLCAVLDDPIGDAPEISNRFRGLLARLKCDPSPFVAAEANLRFERVAVKLGPKLPKAQWDNEVKRIARLEPKVTFESAKMLFMNNLFMNNMSDYSLDDFDRFVSALA